MELVKNKNMKFSFKYIYKDGRTKILGEKASTPENLRYHFDGQLSIDEYNEFVDTPRTTKEILVMAKKINNGEKNIPREGGLKCIEIINVETNEIINYIDM